MTLHSSEMEVSAAVDVVFEEGGGGEGEENRNKT